MPRWALDYAARSTPYEYATNSPERLIDPTGLIVLLAGVGGSAVARTGYEGSIGLYYDTEKGELGWFSTVGYGGGLNVSGDVFVGATTSLNGFTTDTNVVAGNFSGTLFEDPSTGQILGGTVGYGPQLEAIPTFGGSTATRYSHTTYDASTNRCAIDPYFP
jgi:hypothetical protein